eukprot:868059-Rhodomonas_salina.1
MALARRGRRAYKAGGCIGNCLPLRRPPAPPHATSQYCSPPTPPQYCVVSTATLPQYRPTIAIFSTAPPFATLAPRPRYHTPELSTHGAYAIRAPSAPAYALQQYCVAH